MTLKNLTILVADDDEDDKAFLMDAFSEIGILPENVIMTSDGVELLHALSDFKNKPCIVFLDLNMPRKDGRETLREIKSSNMLSHIPVLIFTTSNSREDILSAYRAGGNTFFTKPLYYSELVTLVGAIKDYWFERAMVTF